MGKKVYLIPRSDTANSLSFHPKVQRVHYSSGAEGQFVLHIKHPGLLTGVFYMHLQTLLSDDKQPA